MQDRIVLADASLQSCNLQPAAMRSSPIPALVYPFAIPRLTESHGI